MAQDPQHVDFPGKIFPMTVLTSITPWKKWLLKPFLRWFARRRLTEVEQLRFIHFARWTPFDKEHFTRGRPERDSRPPNRSYYLFSTNFNGPWDQYIDSFSLVRVVRRGMNALWGTSEKFPGAYPIRRFKRFIRYHEYPVEAYYTAYPHATIRDIEAAFIVEQQVALLVAQATSLVPPGTLTLPHTPVTALSFWSGRRRNMLAPNMLDLVGRRGSTIDAINKATNFSPDFSILDELIDQFKAATAPHLGGTRAERAPRHTDGPQDLQL